MLVEYKSHMREIPEDAQLVKVDFLQQVEVQEVSIKPEEMVLLLMLRTSSIPKRRPQ